MHLLFQVKRKDVFQIENGLVTLNYSVCTGGNHRLANNGKMAVNFVSCVSQFFSRLLTETFSRNSFYHMMSCEVLT